MDFHISHQILEFMRCDLGCHTTRDLVDKQIYPVPGSSITIIRCFN